MPIRQDQCLTIKLGYVLIYDGILKKNIKPDLVMIHSIEKTLGGNVIVASTIQQSFSLKPAIANETN